MSSPRRLARFLTIAIGQTAIVTLTVLPYGWRKRAGLSAAPVTGRVPTVHAKSIPAGAVRRALARVEPSAVRRARRAIHNEAYTLSLALPGHRDGLWPGFGEPFNGQSQRLATVRRLIAQHHPDVFVETGTFFGFTTRFFLGQGAPVYSVEIKKTYHAAARLRLGWGAPELRLRHGHSLTTISEVRGLGFARPFAYLDAHWWDDLPLQHEVRELLADDADALIVIDDARVPHDAGYAYDEYAGIPLGLGMLDLPADIRAAFPAAPAGEETGACRGTLYLARGATATAALESVVDAGLLRFAAGTDAETVSS